MKIKNAEVEIIDNQVYVSSAKVAKLFNKKHKEIICDIQNILSSDNFGGIAYNMFLKSICYDKKQECLEYYITEQGLILLIGKYINNVPEIIEEYFDAFKIANQYIANNYFIQVINETMDRISKMKKPLIPTKVYIIKDLKNNYYKIGITSKKIAVRINQLKIGNPNEIVVVYQKQFESREKAIEIETYLHKKFNNFSIEHEWFNLNEKQIKEIIDFLKTK